MKHWEIHQTPYGVDIKFADGSIFTVDDEEMADRLPTFERHMRGMKLPKQAGFRDPFEAVVHDIATLMTPDGMKAYEKASWSVKMSQINPYIHGALCMLVARGCTEVLEQLAPKLWSGDCGVSDAMRKLVGCRS
jgi:hypothetical protein